MKKVLFISMLLLLFGFNKLISQENYKYVPNNPKCIKCIQVFKNKPKEVHFSVKLDSKDNYLYFEVNDKNWFNNLFKTAGDGIAIDIVSKDRYSCLLDNVDKTQIRGEVTSPMFAATLKKTIRPNGKNLFRVRIAKLPEHLLGKELEYNILFLGNRELCRYYNIYDLKSYPWDLLDMGMYLDSLTYKTKLGTSIKEDGYTLKYKTLKFTIPFEKNKFNYSNEDIKPMYDSLRLTDFNIKKIKIRAYSSVEGNLKRNIELQEKRAESIVKALQSFQEPTIVTETNSSENWVEFFNDISKTKYASFKDLNKSEIKSKLIGSVSSELEKYLKNHRKAIIELELQKKDKYKKMTPDELLKLFNQAIKEVKLDEVVELQNSIFEKLKDKSISPDFLNKMNIPKQIKFAKILNKNAAIKYLVNESYLLIAYEELKRIEKLLPKDGEIKYNLVAMKFKLWKYKAKPVDENNFNREILNLKNYGISKKLIDRMLINFHIVRSQLLMRKRDYVNKDVSVNFIYRNYKNISLTDFDCLSLGQFLTYYSNNNYAIELLKDRVTKIDVDEDLLFYYLNLTLVKKELTQTDEYRAMMLNAISKNKKRFCKLFNSVEKGGVTFQLLEDAFLRFTYCENCNNPE